MEYIGNLILPEQILYGAKLVCADGIIQQIVPNAAADTAALPYIAPGFIDIHNHGGLGHDYMEGTTQAFDTVRKHLTQHGITATQPTTVSAPVGQLQNFFDAYRAYVAQADETLCRFVGIHIEGPYIAPAAKGAHQLDTLLTPEKDGYRWILENRDIINEVTVAPELPGIPAMIADLKEAGILVSGGHDASEPEHLETAAWAGMSHCTHIYCAMSTLHKTNGHRVHGLSEFGMAHDSITAEIIADNHHVPPLLAKIIHKVKTADRVCLVSDAIAAAGLPESEEIYSLGTGKNCTKARVENGVAMVEDRSCYAGSVQALDQMIRNLVFDAEIPLVDAVRMATLTPARIIGIDRECGSLSPGKRADLCILGSDLQVLKSVIADNTVYTRGE